MQSNQRSKDTEIGTSDMAGEEIQANMALMAFSDSEVTNDKSCLKNYEALKKQYDDLLVKLDDTGFKASTYKRGLSILEGQILKYKESEVLFSEEIALLKISVGHKEYLMGLLRTELEKLKEEKEGPTPLDLSYSGLEEFKQPEVNEYGPRDSSLKPTTGCDKELDNSKENTDDSIKTIQKTDSKTSSVIILHFKACFICGSFDHIEYSCPKTSHPSLHKHMAPRAVLLKTGLKFVNTARLVNTVRSVNTGRPFSIVKSFNTTRPTYTAHPKSTVHCARSRTYFQNQAQSTVHRPFYKRTTLTKGLIIKMLILGCSRHMTGNIAHLSDFKDFDGGYVTFGGGAYGGRITGKVPKDSFNFSSEKLEVEIDGLGNDMMHVEQLILFIKKQLASCAPSD
ncbi:hypothetical protein Tco_0090831 [Tanacetum coccineum]